MSNQPNVYLLYSYHECPHENNGPMGENIKHIGLFRSEEDAIKEMDKLIQNSVVEGEIIQTFEETYEYSKQITDKDESYYHVYSIINMVVN